jgi:hypothetical protein
MATVREDVFAVVYQRQARLPQQFVAKMFVVGVPKEVLAKQIRERLDASGCRFGEFGVKWANHSLERLDETSPGVQADFEQGTVEKFPWSDLVHRRGRESDDAVRRPRERQGGWIDIIDVDQNAL